MSEAHEIPDEIDPPTDDQAAIEARARTMGWKPLAEYRGPAGRWTDAAEFIAKGETALPVMRDNNRRMSERLMRQDGEITGLRQSVDEMKQVITDLREMSKRSHQQGYDRAMKEIEQRKLAAVEAGDTAAYTSLVNEQERMEAERAAAAPVTTPPKPETIPPAAAPRLDPDTAAFIEENPWFKTDQFLSRKMIDAHIDVIEEHKDWPLADQLDEAKERLMAAYPAKFGIQPRQTDPEEPPPAPAPRARRPASPMPPAGNGGNPPRQQTGTGINSIADPEERKQARTAFDRMKRQFTDYTEAEYMAVYNDPHADILANKPKGKA